MLDNETNYNSSSRDDDRCAAYGFGSGKPNKKQYKEFSPSLFKAYIDKFSDEDKLKALEVLFFSQTKPCSINLANLIVEYING